MTLLNLKWKIPMKHQWPLLFCLLLSACVTTHRPIVHVPPEEAAWFKIPDELPEEGRQSISGTMSAAIQLAMDDFLPWDANPHRGATPREVCLHQRQSYDVKAAPGPEGVILVRIDAEDGACIKGGPVIDMGATYAVDVRNWRILAVQLP